MGLFVESSQQEREEEFLRYLAEIITSTGSWPDQLDVRAGKCVHFQATTFREFHCNRGGIYFQILFAALERPKIGWFSRSRKTRLGRATIRTAGSQASPKCYLTRNGKESSIDCHEIHAV